MSGSQQRRTPPTQEEPLSKKAKTGQPPQQEAQDDEEDPQFSAALDLLQHSSFVSFCIFAWKIELKDCN